MMQGMQPPRRMRFSWESRCRLVMLIEAGKRPHEAAVLCGASRASGYRWWRGYQRGGWAALRDRSSAPSSHPRRLGMEAERAIVAVSHRTNGGAQMVAVITGDLVLNVG